MRKSWFTQPENSFASFYLFDDETGNFVRIRLELDRKGNGSSDNGVPKIMVRKFRCVGFSSNEDYKKRKKSFRKYEATKIVCENRVLCQIPTKGHIPFDFTPNENGIPRGTPHHGNKITTSPHLPVGVTEDTLRTIADKYIKKEEGAYNIIDSTHMDESEFAAKINSCK